MAFGQLSLAEVKAVKTRYGTSVNDYVAELVAQLNDAGFEVITTGLSEFMRAGGAAKCLSLRLNEA